jgi:hypothetical protein
LSISVNLLGEHHYYDTHTAYGSGSTSKMFNERDQEKKKMCLEKGVSLICIPYWYLFYYDIHDIYILISFSNIRILVF